MPKSSLPFRLPAAARSLLFVGICCAGGLGAQSANRSATHPYAVEGPLTAPRLFAEGIVSTGHYDSHPAFTPDGRTLYFLRSTPSFDLWTILVTRFGNGKWRTPEVASFSGRYSDADPFVTPDGSRLWFISNRPVAGKAQPDLDVWYVDRTGEGWGEPKNPGPPINSPGNEWYPTIAANGTIYFGSDREGGKGRTDIYRCRWAEGKYSEAENLGEPINSTFNEFEALVAPDESYLILMAGGRPGARGGFDLYVSHQKSGKWTEPVNLGDAINSAANEYSPAISPDGRYFFWTSARGFGQKPLEKRLDYRELMERLQGARNGLGDVYQIDLRELDLGK